MDPVLAASLAFSGLQNGIKAISSGIELGRAKRALKNATRPEYNIQEEYFDNRNLAANSAQSGYTQQATDFFSDQNDRGLTAGIDAVLQGGATPNGVAKLYDTYNQANARFAAEDSQLREAKLKSFMDANMAVAGQKTQKWAIDKYEPYKDLVKNANKSIESNTQNMWQGIGGVGSTLSTWASARANDTSNPQPATTSAPFAGGGYTDSPVGISADLGVDADPMMRSYIDRLLNSRYPNTMTS